MIIYAFRILFAVSLTAFIFFIYYPNNLRASTLEDTLKNNPEAEEIPMQINIEKVGLINVSVFANENDVYIPLADLLKTLKVNINLVKNNFVATGFFIEEKNNYYIDVNELRAEIKGREVLVQRSDFYVNETDLYMKSDLFKTIFDINMNVDMKRMSIYMNSKNTLPYTLEQQRLSLRNLKPFSETGFSKPDIIIPRERKLLGLGFLDWQLTYSYSNPNKDYYNYNVALGNELIGGDLNVNLYGNKDNAIDLDNSYARWRYVTEESWFKQGIAGDINPVSGLFSSVQGVQLTNAPPISRKILGGYKIFDQIEPNWEVELYVNNEMIAYTRANESGYFEFEVPLLYGSNFITLKYYGPSGEIKTSDRVIQVPYTFLPAGEFEYYLSAGREKTDRRNLLSEASFNFGITSFLTLGGGNSYIDNTVVPRNYPNANLSLKILDGLILSGQYFANYKGRATLNLLLPSQASAEINYLRYEENSYFNPGAIKEEKNISFFLPLTFGGFSSNFRLNASEIQRTNIKQLFIYPGLFMNYGRFQGSAQLNSIYQEDNGIYRNNYLVSNYLLSYRLLDDMIIRNQTDVDHLNNKVLRTGIYVDKSVFNAGWISISVSRDFVQNSYTGGVNFRFYLPFTSMSTNYRADKSGWEIQQSFYGSIGYDDFKNKFITDNRYLSNRAALTFVPYLEKNNNNMFDCCDKILESQLEVKMESGHAVKYFDDKNVWFTDLDPYSYYNLQINPMTFDNPLYRPKYKTYAIYTDPSRFKMIPVPVYITGMVTGYVNQLGIEGRKGVSGMEVVLETKEGVIHSVQQTFSDGEFIFDDVPPGKYKVYLKSEELTRRGYNDNKKIYYIKVKSIEDGDSISYLEFLIKKPEK